MLSTNVITELSELGPLETEWDQLALGNRLPLMSPACVNAWWRHLAPTGAKPHTVVVREGEQLVGLAPFYAHPRRRGEGLSLRLPGIELAGRLAPLAAPGRERDVAEALGGALGASDRRVELVAFEGSPLRSDWSAALREAWPGRRRPASRRYQVSSCPTVSLSAGTFEAWLQAKSSNFRGEMRRRRRQFLAAGGTTRRSTPQTLQADVDAFMRLHAARWEGRGGSHFAARAAALTAALNDIGRELLASDGRFRMLVREIEGEPISAQLFLAAGGHVLYINGGWDERFAKLKPSMLGILDAVEESFERGDEHLDLGLEDQQYKLRFADGNDPVAWTMLMPRDLRLPLTLARTAPLRWGASLRNRLKTRLSEEQLSGLLRVRERMRKLRA